MAFLTIILFFVYCFCLGFTATFFVRNSDNFLERNLMRLGFGLSLLPFLGVVLNLLRIPADWRIILALSLIYPAFYFFKNFKRFSKPSIKTGETRITRTNISIAVMLLIFAGTFYMYVHGAFNYPYLEDDDPWGHAQGVKYVAMEKNVFNEATKYVRYVNPYPPAYDLLMSILHQTNNSVYWTLKFFNALIISLSIIFFYFFMKEFSGNSSKALFATFVLASVPAFMSHFIWALALTVPLFFVSFYAVERIRHDKKWWIVAGLVMFTTLTSSPTHSVYFALFFGLYITAKIILERKLLIYHALGGLLGAALSYVFWWAPMILRYGVRGTLEGLSIISKAGKVTSGGGTGDRIYNFSDFFVTQKINMINNPIGIGVVAFILVFIALFAIYYYFFKISSSIGGNSKIKNKIIKTLGIISIILFLIGLLFFFGSNRYNPFVKEESIMLEKYVKSTFVIMYLSLLLLALLFFYCAKNVEDNNKWLVVTLVWFLFGFFAVNSAVYPYKISPFRSWMLFAIPVAILASQGAFFLMEILKKFGAARIVLMVILIIGIYYTSAQQKITVNTAEWFAGGFWTSVAERDGYVWLRDNIPPDTKVFSFVVDGPVIGMDKFTCYWCEDIREFKKAGGEKSASEIHSFLKSRDYKYVIIDGQFAQKYGANETNNKIKEILDSGLFRPRHQTNGFLLFELS